MSVRTLAAYIIGSLLITQTAHAQAGADSPEWGSAPAPGETASDMAPSNGASAPNSDRVSVLLKPGLAFAPDYEGSRDYALMPLWSLRAANLYHLSTYVQIFGTSLVSNLLPHDELRLGPSATYVQARRNVKDDRADAVGDTRDGLLLGAAFGYERYLPELGMLGAGLDARYDVAGEIGGLVTLRGSYARSFAGGLWGVAIMPELTFASADYMTEFFGVDENASAQSGLGRYEPGAGFKDAGLTVDVSVRLSERLDLEGVLRYARLLGDAAESPLVSDVGNDDQWAGGLLVGYRL